MERSHKPFWWFDGTVRKHWKTREICLLHRNIFRHFADINAKAMDTSWFRRAVDQHSIEPDSFVFSVPFDSGYNGKNSSVLVTAAHAMFIEHRGHKAAAAVVGLQYTHESLSKHFINITSAVRMNNLTLNHSLISLFFSVREVDNARKLVHRTSLTAIYWTIMDLYCCQKELNTRESSSDKLMER